ncbi:type II secretion system protein GspN [bacterium]|nr:type II secretion system protein GspN [bacterium]
MKRLILASVLAVLGVFIFALTLFHLVPSHVYERLISATLREKTGLVIESASFSTVFPFGFELKDARLSDANRRGIARLDSIRADLMLRGILSGLRVDFKGTAGEGAAEGSFRYWLFGSSLDMESRDIDFSYIEALGSAGVKVDGTFDGRLSVKSAGGCPKGFARMEGSGLGDAEFRLRGIPLSFGGIDEAGLSADLRDCTVFLNGLWVEGDKASLRLQGSIKPLTPLASSPVDLTLEIVPHAELLQNNYLLAFIEPYRKSANFYSIPVRGTLGNLLPGL